VSFVIYGSNITYKYSFPNRSHFLINSNTNNQSPLLAPELDLVAGAGRAILAGAAAAIGGIAVGAGAHGNALGAGAHPEGELGRSAEVERDNAAGVVDYADAAAEVTADRWLGRHGGGVYHGRRGDEGEDLDAADHRHQAALHPATAAG